MKTLVRVGRAEKRILHVLSFSGWSWRLPPSNDTGHAVEKGTAKLHLVRGVEKTFLHQGDAREQTSKLGLGGLEDGMLMPCSYRGTICHIWLRPEAA